MMTKQEMLQHIEQANKEISRVISWVEEHEEAFRDMDLKLHDAQMYQWREMEKDFPLTYEDEKDDYSGNTTFYLMCEEEYNSFLYYLAENGIEWSGKNGIRHGIGRTSSFYLHDRNIIDFSNRPGCPLLKNDIVENFTYNEWNVSIPFKDGFIDTNIKLEDYEECYVEYVDYIIDSLYYEFVNEFSDVIEVYEYIKGVKDNQVEIFKGYLQCTEEMLQNQKDEAEAYEAERQSLLAKFSNEIVREIYDRNNIANKDLQTLLTTF